MLNTLLNFLKTKSKQQPQHVVMVEKDDWFPNTKPPTKNHVTIPAPKKLTKDPWFDDHPNPLDSMPIATDSSMHEKMYQMATSKYNPFSVGGSENCHGGSEQVQNK